MQPLRSQPVNWGIDMSQNRAGEYWGRAFANTGSMLGNAILEYSKQKEEKEKKKQEEEAAARMLMAGGYVKDPKEADDIVKGIGGPKQIISYINQDTQRKQVEQQAEENRIRALVAEQKANQEREKAEALKRFTEGLMATTSTPEYLPGQDFLPENERRQHLTQSPNIRTGRDVLGLGAQTGALAHDPTMVKSAADLIRSDQDPRLVRLPNGEQAIIGASGSMHVTPKPFPPQIEQLINARNAARESGDTERAKILDDAITKMNSLSEGTVITQGPDGLRVSVGGQRGGADSEAAKAQAREASINRVLAEAEGLRKIINSGNLGLKGVVNEAFAAAAGQLGLDVNTTATHARQRLRMFREGALRLMSDEKGAFSNRDRATIERLFPDDGIMENIQTFNAKMDALNIVLSGRSRALAKMHKADSVFDLSEDQVGEMLKNKTITNDEAFSIVRAIRLNAFYK